MKISLELIAISRRPGPRLDCIELDEGATPDDLLDALALPEDEPYMTLVNGQSVAPGLRAGTRLNEGDKVIVFPPLKGG